MIPMALQHVGLDVLDEHESLRLLSTTHFGRVALTIGALPAIFPIHFTLHEGNPIFRTDPGAKLMAAAAGNILCLEADHCDDLTHTGWSVMVTGPAHVITDEDELEAVRALPLRPWVGRGDVFVRLQAVLVSGRRIAASHPH
jgi:nitroimidazol reductase NimA-like FMN-containing flavoprotein (pyridoxamine 5'-phosphate oxidase superfamily)